MISRATFGQSSIFAAMRLSVFMMLVLLLPNLVSGQTPVPMISQSGLSYTENFADITNWTNAFASGTGANRWAGVALNATGTIPDGIRTTASTTSFVTASTEGVQKGTGNIVLLSTNATSNSHAVAIDFFMDFSGVNAGTLSFDAATVFNSTGDRVGSLKVYASTNGTSFTELTGTNLPYVATNNVTNSASITSIQLPSSFNNSATARLRFYQYNGTATGTTGSRPKISADNIVVTATPATPTTTSISPTSATVGGAGFTLTVNGTNFVTGLSTVTWGGATRTTTFVSSTQLTAAILTADIASTGTVNVGVTTTGAAASSNTQTFSIVCPSITATFAGATTICSGASTNLSATVTGGISPYTLTLDNSGGTATTTSPVSKSVSPTSTTPYTATVTDSKGCAATVTGNTQTVTVTNANTATGGSWSAGGTWTCGVAPTTTTNVTIPTGVTVTLDVNATINDLTFTGGGKLTLGAQTLTANGTVTGDATVGYVVTDGAGALKQNLAMNASKMFPVGPTNAIYAPSTVNNGASVRDFSVSVGTTLTSPAVPAKTVQLQWNVTPSNLVGNSAALTFQWPVGSQGGSFSPTGPVEIAHYNTTTSTWDTYILATVNAIGMPATDYTATTTSNATAFSPFVVANQNALSVDLLNISAQSKGTKNVVNWSTASEKNNAYFEVQHATNGLDFQPISDKIKGKGTTNVKNDYTFEHSTPSVIRDYYRLKQVDNDGTTTLSKVVSVVGTGKNGALKVYPTLASDKLTISLDSKETVDFNVYNLVGQAVQSGQLTGQKELIISQLPNGVYFLKVGNATVTFSKN